MQPPPPALLHHDRHSISLPKALQSIKTTDSLQSALRDLVLGDVESTLSTSRPDLHDGDTRGWMTVLGAFSALFCSFGHLSSFGTYQAWYGSHQFHDLPPSTISWIGSLQLFVFFLCGAPIGRVFDAYGQLGLLTTGTATLVTSIALTSISTRYYQYIIFQGVFFSLGVGMLFYPSLACISTHFTTYRATALGLAATGSSIGGVVYPIMLRHLFKRIGFGWAMRVSALVTLLFGLIALATVKRRNITRTTTSAPWIDMTTFRDPRFTLLAAGCFFVASGLFIPFIFITDYTRDHSNLAHLHIYILAIVNLGSIPGRIIPARLADTIGHFSLLAPAAFFSGVACFALWLPQRDDFLLAFAATYGFTSGAFVAVLTSCIARISDVRVIGTRIGMLYSIISLPSLLGGPTAGVLLLRMNGSYTGMITFSGSTIIIGSVLIFLAKLQVDPRIFARV